MKVLLDTNVLYRLAELHHPHHAVAAASLVRLVAAHDQPCLVPQVVYEYWVVATRPRERNGLGMSAEDVNRTIDAWDGRFTLLRDERRVYDDWRELVSRYQIKGKPAHDARLVAAMLRHAVTSLVTFNVADFSRYTEIKVYSPEELLHDSAS